MDRRGAPRPCDFVCTATTTCFAGSGTRPSGGDTRGDRRIRNRLRAAVDAWGPLISEPAAGGGELEAVSRAIRCESLFCSRRRPTLVRRAS